MLCGLLMLPEGLPPERRRAFSWRRANPPAALRLFGATGSLRRLGFAWSCGWLALDAQRSSFILANQMRFCWNTAQNGLALALGGIAQVLVQACWRGRSCAGWGARRSKLAGYGPATAGYGALALAMLRAVMPPAILLMSVGALVNPAIRSMLSIAAGPQRQGEAQGGLTSLQELSLVAGPLSTGLVFTLATRPGKTLRRDGAPFALAALVCVAGGDGGGAVAAARGHDRAAGGSPGRGGGSSCMLPRRRQRG